MFALNIKKPVVELRMDKNWLLGKIRLQKCVYNGLIEKGGQQGAH